MEYVQTKLPQTLVCLSNQYEKLQQSKHNQSFLQQKLLPQTSHKR